jgi:hypothetical protein
MESISINSNPLDEDIAIFFGFPFTFIAAVVYVKITATFTFISKKIGEMAKTSGEIIRTCGLTLFYLFKPQV